MSKASLIKKQLQRAFGPIGGDLVERLRFIQRSSSSFDFAAGAAVIDERLDAYVPCLIAKEKTVPQKDGSSVRVATVVFMTDSLLETTVYDRVVRVNKQTGLEEEWTVKLPFTRTDFTTEVDIVRSKRE